MQQVKYFEVIFDDDSFSICVLRKRMPTRKEAADFLRRDMKKFGLKNIEKIQELSKEEAYGSFDMDNFEAYPVFERAKA